MRFVCRYLSSQILPMILIVDVDVLTRVQVYLNMIRIRVSFGSQVVDTTDPEICYMYVRSLLRILPPRLSGVNLLKYVARMP